MKNKCIYKALAAGILHFTVFHIESQVMRGTCDKPLAAEILLFMILHIESPVTRGTGEYRYDIVNIAPFKCALPQHVDAVSGPAG